MRHNHLVATWIYLQAIVRIHLLSWCLPSTWWTSFHVPVDGSESYLPFTYILSNPTANVIVKSQWSDLQQSLKWAAFSFCMLACLRWGGLLFRETTYILGGVDVLNKEEALQQNPCSSGDLIIEGVPIDSQKGILWLWGNNRSQRLCWQSLYQQVKERSLTFCSHIDAHMSHDDLLYLGDDRSVRWNMWDETHRDVIIQHFLPNDMTHDPFWIEAARIVLKCSIDALQTNPSYQKLVQHVMHASLQETEEFYADTPAAIWMNASSKESVLFIREALKPCMDMFKSLPDPTNGWSIQKWIPTDRSLMLVSDHPFWKPLVSLLWKLTNHAMQKNQTKLWILVENHRDLIISLRDIPSVYPGTLGMIIGVSDFSPSINAVLQQGTHVIFGGVDVTTSEHLSRACGYQEILEIGQGKCRMADGITLRGLRQSVP